MDRVWRYGGGRWAAGLLTEVIALRLDPRNPDVHGFVEPASEMSVTVFESALAATRSDWAIDEE